jgi:transmembrane sensor
MTTSNDAARRADAEAVEWIIRLYEDPDDPAVRARFETWLAASSLNARAWTDTARAYDRAGEARPAFSSSPRAPISRARPRRVVGRRTLIAAAAACLAAACLALVAAPAVLLRLHADHVTGTAEIRTVSLADGSTVQLAPESAIAVDYSATRQVHLLKGEAWFDVEHDPSRPFQVDAGGVTTTAIGTAFDVKLDREGAEVALARGRVRVEYSAKTPVVEQLAPGESVRVTFNGTVSRTTQTTTGVAAWRDRQIVVQDRPVSEVIDALRPWFTGTILMRGNGFARERVTGVYNTADPIEALRGLVQAHGGRVTQITPWVLVLTER